MHARLLWPCLDYADKELAELVAHVQGLFAVLLLLCLQLEGATGNCGPYLRRCSGWKKATSVRAA